MGVGGNFWELLKPYARHEGADFLRDKKVAVDLSFWIVQNGTAVSKCYSPEALKPHLRITLFRAVNLFAKMGAYPVFVVDGEASPLKTRARIERFSRATGLDLSTSPTVTKAEVEGASVKRNPVFSRWVDECVELLEYLGLPILRARSEAEALCAQLNAEGLVDACITADSDAILYGATCVIKCLRPNSKDPIECYNMSDIEAGLGLKRKQLIAISLLVGNDHDLKGVSGIGIDSAVRFVQIFDEDNVLDRLSQVGKGDPLCADFPDQNPDEGSLQKSVSHCSNCGHPGSRKVHTSIGCEECLACYNRKCNAKPKAFRCTCSICDEVSRVKESKRQRSWQIKVCKRISDEPNFPNSEIIKMYLNNSEGMCDELDGPALLWKKPKVDDLVDFLAYHLHWEPSYTRQRVLPMLSTIFLREMAADSDDRLLMGQYKFHSIHRVKIRYSQPCYVVKWTKIGATTVLCTESISENKPEFEQVKNETDIIHIEDTDEPDLPEILIDEGCSFLLTDESMSLIEAAFPVETEKFLKEKELKGNSKRKKLAEGVKSPETPKSSSIQLSIPQFYRAAKSVIPANIDDKPNSSSGQGVSTKRGNTAEDASDRSLFKSVRRRLQFD